jgi:hypothetical protein
MRIADEYFENVAKVLGRTLRVTNMISEIKIQSITNSANACCHADLKFTLSSLIPNE